MESFQNCIPSLFSQQFVSKLCFIVALPSPPKIDFGSYLYVYVVCAEVLVCVCVTDVCVCEREREIVTVCDKVCACGRRV